MGFFVSGNAYTHRLDDITDDLPRVEMIVDNSLLWNQDIEASFRHTFEYLKLGEDNGINFNKDKFQFAQEEDEFADFELTQDGYQPLKNMRGDRAHNWFYRCRGFVPPFFDVVGGFSMSWL